MIIELLTLGVAFAKFTMSYILYIYYWDFKFLLGHRVICNGQEERELIIHRKGRGRKMFQKGRNSGD